MTDATLAARVVLDVEHDRGDVDPRLFGSFVEHMGRGVYGGIYDPGHPAADRHGFRRDVEDLVRELGVTLVRYPGGNFVSGYRWEDGIGPKEQRPRRLDLAWRSIESNQVGTDDFLGWARRNRLAPMMAVNLGTRGVQEACDLVEYCNVPGGTRWSDLRRHNGHTAPHGVTTWCLGNEMDGPWQIGHTTAERYGLLADQTGRAMKMIDPSIELVACGSSGHTMNTFGYWESEVLEAAWDTVDYISMHGYYEEHDGDRRSFLASGADMAAYIDGVTATIDAVAARKHSRKRVQIAFDEWNVWYMSRFQAIGTPPIDEAGPRIEDTYSALDAVVVGDLLVTLLNHADRVRIGCLAQLVNVIAPIRTEPSDPRTPAARQAEPDASAAARRQTEPDASTAARRQTEPDASTAARRQTEPDASAAAWRQTVFHPFAAAATTARGRSLVTRVTGPQMRTRRYGDVPAVAAAATHDPAGGTTAVFVTNRAGHPVTLTITCAGPATTVVDSCRVLVADRAGPRGREAARSFEFAPLPARIDGRDVRLTVPAEAWVVLTTRPAPPR